MKCECLERRRRLYAFRDNRKSLRAYNPQMEGIRFLNAREAAGVSAPHCLRYVREWLQRERES